MKAPPLMLGEEISSTPPSKKTPLLPSRTKLLRKLRLAEAETTEKSGDSRYLLLPTGGSSTNAQLGAVSGFVVEATQVVLDQPGGRAGAVTLSKFWVTILSHTVGEGEAVAVGEAVGDGVAVGGEGVGNGVGLGDGRHSLAEPRTGTMMGAPVLKKPIVAFTVVGGVPARKRKL